VHQFFVIRRVVNTAVALVAIATVAPSTIAHAETGIASYYNGRHPRAGALTCAHKSAPFGTRYQVTRLDGGGRTTCIVNDRGPYGKGFVIDLSIAAARQLGIIRSGITKVSIARI
jgi:peptidoglycan lytic transglycosylase